MLSFVQEKKKWQPNFDQQSIHSLHELVNLAKSKFLLWRMQYESYYMTIELPT